MEIYKINKLIAIKYYLIFLMTLGIVQISNGQIMVEKQSKDLLHKISQAKKDTAKIDLYYRLTELYRYNDLNKAIKYVQGGLSIAKKHKHYVGTYKGYQKMIEVHFLMGSPPDSLLKYIQLLEQTIKKEKNTANYYLIPYVYGIYYDKVGEPELNLKSKLEILKFIREDKRLQKYEATTLLNIAIIFSNLGRKKESLSYYQQALAIEKNEVIRGKILLYMGRTHYQVYQDIDTIQYFFDEALQIFKKHNELTGVVEIKQQKAFYYQSKQQFSKGEKELLEALAISKAQKFGSLLIGIYVDLGEYYLEAKDYTKAIEYSKMALIETESQQISTQNIEIYEVLHQSYAASHQYESAYASLKNLTMQQDSLTNLAYLEKVKELETKYKVKEQEQENATLKLTQENVKKRNRIKIIGLLVALVFAIGWGVSVYRNNQVRKQYSQELEQKNQLLKSINDAKTQFFANISHELKTPLTLIINPIQQLLKEKGLSNNQEYLLKTAKKNSLDLFDLTHQILELTKFEEEKVILHNSQFLFKPFIQKTFANFESLAQSKAIRFELEYQGNEDLAVETDRYKLKIILKNLITNALKFTSASDSIKLSVIEKTDVIDLILEDTGRGIHAQDLPYVFERYFQSHLPKLLSEGGTGIGLAICQEYTKLLGGNIQVQSEFGKGTTFFIQIPKKEVDLRNVQRIESTEENPSLLYPIITKNTAVKENILLVEDNIEMQNYIKYVLQNDFNIIATNNGAVALEILKTQADHIQLILSDAMMPVMDGYEFLKILKNDKNFASIPTIMLTALSNADYKLKGLRIGIDDYLTKPFDNEELIVRIENLITNYKEKKEFIQNLSGREDTIEKSVLLLTNTTEVEQSDLEWLYQAEAIVQQEMIHSDFTIDTFAHEMTMSRSQLYRKIKTLTGLSPTNYINQIRFETARKLLENKMHSSIKAIAYTVGFKDEKNFSRNFKKLFGKYPSEYLG